MGDKFRHSQFEREQIVKELWPLANDAKAKWIEASDDPAGLGKMLGEYERGYMNAMHQAIGIVEGRDD